MGETVGVPEAGLAATGDVVGLSEIGLADTGVEIVGPADGYDVGVFDGVAVVVVGDFVGDEDGLNAGKTVGLRVGSASVRNAEGSSVSAME